jgi:HSP20 family protein
MAIVRWEPFRLFPRWRRWPSLWEEEEEWPETSVVSRGLDVYETENEVVVKAAIPGVDPKKVDVTYQDGRLWVKGELEEEEKGRKYYRKSARSFDYALDVPNVDPVSEPKSATIEDGVLSVTFAKTKPKKVAKKVPVKVKAKR